VKVSAFYLELKLIPRGKRPTMDSEHKDADEDMMQWINDPIFSAALRIPNEEILNLRSLSGYEGSFQYYGHPVSRVDLLAVIISKEIFNPPNQKSRVKYLLDDGTGLVPGILWLKPNTPECDWNFQLGQFVNVCGRLNRFRDRIEVIINLIRIIANFVRFSELSMFSLNGPKGIEDDVNAESLRLLEIIDLTLNVYSKPKRNFEQHF